MLPAWRLSLILLERHGGVAIIWQNKPQCHLPLVWRVVRVRRFRKSGFKTSATALGGVRAMDERITAALKGLDQRLPALSAIRPLSYRHPLVGPCHGIWVIEPYYQRGTITCEKNRWRQKGGGLVLGYLKIFGQRVSAARPDLWKSKPTCGFAHAGASRKRWATTIPRARPCWSSMTRAAQTAENAPPRAPSSTS